MWCGDLNDGKHAFAPLFLLIIVKKFKSKCIIGINEMKIQGAPLQSGEKLVLNPASDIFVKLSATSSTFFTIGFMRKSVQPQVSLFMK